MRAVIIAAGRGARLAPLTDTAPKCMVEVAGRPLLYHAVAQLRAAGIADILVIRGYAADQVRCEGVRFADNTGWSSTNVLGSLFSSPDEIAGDLLILYSDILFHRSVVDIALAAVGAIVPVVDRGWREAYQGRSLHPVSEAEKVSLDAAGRIRGIGKSNVTDAAADAEFIGMIKLEALGAARLAQTYAAVGAAFAGQPFISAARFEQAYLTDLLQYLIVAGDVIPAAVIHGGWREIDTVEDLAAARRWYAASA